MYCELNSNIKNLIKYQDFNGSQTSISANGTTTYSFNNISLTGYTPIAIVDNNTNNGSSGTLESWISVYRYTFEVNNTKATLCFKNMNTSAAASIVPRIRIIYLKNF